MNPRAALKEIENVEKMLGVSALDSPQLVIGALASKLVEANEKIAHIVADTISNAGLCHIFNKKSA